MKFRAGMTLTEVAAAIRAFWGTITDETDDIISRSRCRCIGALLGVLSTVLTGPASDPFGYGAISCSRFRGQR